MLYCLWLQRRFYDQGQNRCNSTLTALTLTGSGTRSRSAVRQRQSCSALIRDNLNLKKNCRFGNPFFNLCRFVKRIVVLSNGLLFCQTDCRFVKRIVVLSNRLLFCQTDCRFDLANYCLDHTNFCFGSPPLGENLSFLSLPLEQIYAPVRIELESDLNTPMLAFKDL